MGTAGTHVDGVGEDHSEDDEEFGEAQEDQDVVDLEVEADSIEVVAHRHCHIRKEGVRLEKKNYQLYHHASELS